MVYFGVLQKVIENLGGRFAWSTISCLAKFLRKFNNLKDLTISGEEASFASYVHFNPSFRHHVHHTHVVYVLVCYFKVCFVLS